ncbi:MAG: adenylate/guanylate cyclase domain-containing protein [SAR202 cluster bacterium]|jgi:class 3 adenylate cyclase|nr:adenylate/guanylate cyclase domain-containing protein [SAR202 cluster bacterium]
MLETLTSYIPPPVARRLAGDPNMPTGPSSEQLPAAVMFADISGFTPLAERLAERGVEGAEDLSNAVNGFFGRFIDLTASHGGEALYFAGDSAIVLWPATDLDDDLPGLTHRAAQCALEIMSQLNGLEVAEDVRLSIRVGLSAGRVMVASVGGVQNRWQCLFAGDPMHELGAVGNMGDSGEIILAPNVQAMLGNDSRVHGLVDGYARLEALDSSVPLRSAEIRSLSSAAEAGLRAYVPEPVLANIDSGQTGWLAELRRVTVVFINLPTLDYSAEDILQRLQSTTVAMMEAIHRYGGAVNQFLEDDKGTTLLAAWGLPAGTHEDDPTRALRAALEIQSRLSDLDVEAKIGVATGRVFCGNRGNELRREYAMFGSTMNLASRLMQAASDAILCDETTYHGASEQASEADISFQVLPPFALKGIENPTPVHRVRPSHATDQMLVGRATERAALAETLEWVRTHMNAESATRVAVIEGEPGIGKSQLLDDFLEMGRGTDVEFLIGSGRSIESSTPYFAWRSVFNTVLDMDSVPDDQRARQKHVLERLRTIDTDADDLAPLLNTLLPLGFAENQITVHMRGESRSNNTNQLLARLLALDDGRRSSDGGDVNNETSRRQRVLVLEDAHWLDSASWALLSHVISEVEGMQIILVTRPIFSPAPREFEQLRRDDDVAWIRPAALSKSDTHTLAQVSLGVPAVADEIVDFVHMRAAGNPFFTEELCYALRDTGLIVVSDGICRINQNEDVDLSRLMPDSVQGTVASRIDQLPPQLQLTIKVASVIGQTFPVNILKDIYPVQDDRPNLPEFLEGLENLGLTVDVDSENDPAFRFKHAITQNVAYDLLPFAQRRELHQVVAEWLEINRLDDLSPHYPALAYHWSETDATEKAIEYLDKSGEQALDNDANREAIQFLNRASDFDQSSDTSSVALENNRLRLSRRQYGLTEAFYRLGQLSESEEHCKNTLEVQGHRLPKSSVKLVLKALGLLGHQIGRRFPLPFLSRSSSKSDSEREETVLAYQAYLRFTWISFLNSNTTMTVLGTLNCLKLAESLGPSAELAHAYAMICGASGLIPARAGTFLSA